MCAWELESTRKRFWSISESVIWTSFDTRDVLQTTLHVFQLRRRTTLHCYQRRFRDGFSISHRCSADISCTFIKNYNLPHLSIMIFDASQGREFDFVIVDIVISNEGDHSLRFLTNMKKISVVLSRAKHGLIAINSKDMGKVTYANKGAKIWTSLVQDHAITRTAFFLIINVNGPANHHVG